MNRDDVIRMAREAGAHEHCVSDSDDVPWSLEFSLTNLEDFAALVAAAEREACDRTAATIHQLRIDVDSLKSERDEALRTVRENRTVTHEMLAALERQVANIANWLETGVPVDPEESRSIYEQMVAAIARARGGKNESA